MNYNTLNIQKLSLCFTKNIFFLHRTQVTIKIELPHHINYLPVSLQAVRSIGRLAGFSEEDLSKLETATEEVVSDVVRFAYNKDDKSSFNVLLKMQSMGLLIIIKEDSLPFSSETVAGFDPAADLHKSDCRGYNNILIKQLVDKVWFHSLGNEGLETHLFKYLKNFSSHIKSLKDAKLTEKQTREPKQKNDVDFSIRRMKPEEAIDVSDVAYNSYGNTYLHQDIYYPDRVRELNKSNHLMSYIAVTSGEEIIAHIAFIKSNDEDIPEIGIAFTKPNYRGIGCLNKLMKTSLEEAEKLGFNGVFAQAVTSHPYSQKSLHTFGFLDCALLLSIFHELSFRNIEQKKQQRESTMVCFRNMKHPLKVTIYPPAHHKKMIIGIYTHLGFSPAIKPAEIDITPDFDQSELSVKTDLENSTADIGVVAFGKNILMEVHRLMKTLCHHDTKTVYLRLKLADPFTAKYTSEFEKMGFFFAGILPQSEANDELILQYLNNYSIDFDQIKIASDKGKEILAYVKKCCH